MSAESISAAEYWETRYRENGKSWSGNANAALVREVTGLTPGRAVDLGSGEGGDALWLARQGWSVTAVDISPTALAIGQAAQRPDDDITWVAADLSEWDPSDTYDLVCSSFLHSTVHLPRERILRRAAQAVAPGGVLVVIGHSGVPHWAEGTEHAHPAQDLPTPDDVLQTLFAGGGSVRAEWTIVTSALVERPLTAPDGPLSSIVDSVLTLRRSPEA